MNIRKHSTRSSGTNGYSSGFIDLNGDNPRRRSTWSTAMLIGLVALGGVAAQAPLVSAKALTARDQPLVDTKSWLKTIAKPQGEWKSVIESREDVLRHRFVRFRRPDNLPSPNSRFVIQPFADTKLTMRLRRDNQVGEDSYAWFGTPESDPLGWGGFVVRSNGRIALSIKANGKRFEVVNVGEDAYAVLELAPQEPFRCEHGEHHNHDHGHKLGHTIKKEG